MSYLRTAEQFTTGENQAVTYAILAVAIELQKMRERTAFALPSGRESINLNNILSVEISPYKDDEIFVHINPDKPALIYRGVDAKALAREFGLQWPKTGGDR